MKCNMFTTSEATLLAIIAAQFASTVLAAPLADVALNNIFERQACAYPLSLGTAKGFTLLAKGGITNSGVPLSITGDIGVTPAGTITGITAAQVTGTIHANNAVASAAAAVAANRCACALSKSPAVTTSGVLGGVTFAPGTYRITGAASAAANTFVTLDGASNPNGQWIFQISGSFTTGANVEIKLINGAKACNVYWVVGTSSINAATTLGATNIFNGNICDYGAITAGINLVANGSWFTLPAANIITIAGGTLKAVTTC
ncbi:hypothetical protein EPUS_07830 [Endocarpon pusillum Z07020]|uniref:Ice-binding protein n=1 Tax=Endocarpon pusillum (strain Z07020 / HMAS-L-300199) TaxID=1263415 RepID=U1GCJ8_ENDPU|nr:uncharacterized protein EPUS_07830 [Endocarpon pusillum Z07020]ERF69426.1 hypothetical protein EPUS_07830 [Endocarpon pusillum Z07020]